MNFEEINLTKEEVDKLEETLESLRDFGRAHFNFSEGEITFNCEAFAKNKEDYEKDIKQIEERE